jgi:hypothetical protein
MGGVKMKSMLPKQKEILTLVSPPTVWRYIKVGAISF